MTVALLLSQAPLQQYVDRIARQEPLAGAVFGVMVQDRDGRVLASYQPDRKMVPASNMKLVTTGAALHALGADYRFETRIGYTGEIREGTLHGDVYIIGGGDPTIGVKDSIALRPDALFWKWKTLLKGAGISRIDGRIIGDGRAYEGHLENTSWTYDDTGTYYGTGCSALSFYANAVDYAMQAGVEGSPVEAVQTYPETPWMHFSNYGTTGPAGTGNSLYLYTTDLAPYAELRGSFAVDRKPKTEHFANKYGALTCAYYFWKNLRATGWEVTGSYADIDRGGYVRSADFVPSAPAGEPTAIGTSTSPTLSQIVRETNHRSDNFYAETLLRTLGERSTGIAAYDSCYVALGEVLECLGLPPEGVRVEDGSGLSRNNYVSPHYLSTFLRAMTASPAFDAFLASLPQPGTGTVRTLPVDPARRSRVRLKSGSMDGVLCYSGYILSADGLPEKTFSLMVNNCTVPTAEIRSCLARLIDRLMD